MHCLWSQIASWVERWALSLPALGLYSASSSSPRAPLFLSSVEQDNEGTSLKREYWEGTWRWACSLHLLKLNYYALKIKGGDKWKEILDEQLWKEGRKKFFKKYKWDKCLNGRKETGTSKKQMRPTEVAEMGEEKGERGKKKETRLGDQKADAS